jgi:hypothetical protein|tara:strand:- start:2227 stop:2484 length:258 start_codon:yes stop_codon:yes gene_type:complete
MASKKSVKKNVQSRVYIIMDACDEAIDGGNENKTADKLMDDVVDFYEAIMPKINNAKAKAEFKTINDDISKSLAGFEKKAAGLSK